jgi:YegS/Rv2252/BmrU family lipid kinase
VINPDLILGTLPIGTGSDFIRSLGIPNKLGEALSFMQRRKVASIDVGFAIVQDLEGKTKEHLFLNILSCGLSADVALRVNQTSSWGGPFFRYLRSSLVGIAHFDNNGIKIRYDAGDTHYEGPFTLLAVANGRYFGGGMFVAPQAQLDDGLFQVVLIKKMPKIELLSSFASIYKGEHLNLPEILTCQNSQIDVSSIGGPVYVEADGEPIGTLPLQVGCLQKSLKIIAGNM